VAGETGSPHVAPQHDKVHFVRDPKFGGPPQFVVSWN
jgi:hypothetical protein